MLKFHFFELHSLTSTIPAILIPLAVVLSAYPISKIWGNRWGYTSFLLGVLSMVSGPIMFIEYLDSYTGLIQRLGLGFSLLWIFIRSLKIYKETREKLYGDLKSLKSSNYSYVSSESASIISSLQIFWKYIYTRYVLVYM